MGEFLRLSQVQWLTCTCRSCHWPLLDLGWLKSYKEALEATC